MLAVWEAAAIAGSHMRKRRWSSRSLWGRALRRAPESRCCLPCSSLLRFLLPPPPPPVSWVISGLIENARLSRLPKCRVFSFGQNLDLHVKQSSVVLGTLFTIVMFEYIWEIDLFLFSSVIWCWHSFFSNRKIYNWFFWVSEESDFFNGFWKLFMKAFRNSFWK